MDDNSSDEPTVYNFAKNKILPSSDLNNAPWRSKPLDIKEKGLLNSSRKKVSNDWPDSLKRYVAACFKQCKDDKERDEMEEKLQKIIRRSIEQNTISTKDWFKTNPLSVMFESSKDPKNVKNAMRAKRFERELSLIKTENENELDITQFDIVGTCLDLEKSYFRLTSAPSASSVRPLNILKKALEQVKRKWAENGDYNYTCDQLKAIRQDLVVQRIINEFTVHVYEVHARIALERSDLGEYNQCQTRLLELYTQGLKGSITEFVSYHILYLTMMSNYVELNNFILKLRREFQNILNFKDFAVNHAIMVRDSIISSNYSLLFRLYKSVPNMGIYLMDHFIEKNRTASFVNFCKVYKPTISMNFLKEILCFDSVEELDGFIKRKFPEYYQSEAATLFINSQLILNFIGN